MALGFGQTTRKDILAYTFKGTALTSKAISAFAAAGNLFLSLHTADPGVDGQTSNEVSTSGTAYAAKSTATTDWNTPTDNTTTVARVTNATVLSYAQATGSGFGTLTHSGIWSHVTTRTAGFFVGRGALGTSQAVAAGNTFSFPIGTFVVDLADGP